ncbi:TIGR03545 family protein [Aliikangiella sp. G2MR2-5]|uniref:TIGR03545 family protein n=1 Tax=Aliikangiella sp. G2MR2-5 TaxID=2788943 RepID=UPI0018AC0648|nr:TIGR03545 family protein [Aliikangiella sp. G2MR2-5]
MKIIRWWGVLAFAVLLLLITLVWYFLAPRVIASSIEQSGSEVLGARVEIASVDLALFPLSVSIKGLQAADPEEPMTNIFESEEVKFAIDSSALLWKKVVIDELTLTGLKTGTQRETSGALPGGRKSSQAIDKVVELVVPDVANFDVKKMVEDADLITLKRIAAFKESKEQIETQWDKDLDKEAFDKRIEKIKAEYKRLADRAKDNKLNLLKDKKEWKALKRDIDVERERISSLSGKLKSDKSSLSKQYQSIKQGPKDDLNAILKNVGLDSGVESLVDKYIGPQYTPYVMQALDMIKSFEPSSAGAEEKEKAVVQMGQKVYFKDEINFPEFLVKKVTMGGSNEGWNIDGKGFDLGYLPWLTGKPAKLNLSFGGKGSANFNVESHWPSANKMKTTIDSKVAKWPLESMELMQTTDGNWIIDSGELSAELTGNITLESINLSAKFAIASPKLSFPETLGGWQKSLAQSINGQSKINFELTATGTINEPKIRLKSSIENLFKQAVGEQLKKKAEGLKGKVNEALSEKIGDFSSLQNFGSQFKEWQSKLKANDDVLEQLKGKIKI